MKKFNYYTEDNGYQLTLRDKETNNWLGYVRYWDKRDQYWAPRIYLSFIEVNSKDRQKGIGSLVIEELKLKFPGEIITLETYTYGETRIEYLDAFYKKNGFELIKELSSGYAYAYVPEGRSLEEFNDVPIKVLFDEVKHDSQKYDLANWPIELLQEILEDEGIDLDKISLKEFRDIYERSKDSEGRFVLRYL